MKTSIIISLCCAALQAAGQDAKRLEALGQIESGNNDRAVGRAGEVSRYQIMPAVWARYSLRRDYLDLKEASRVATAHLEWLKSYFWVHAGGPATNFDLYVLWNTRHGYYARHGFDRNRIAKSIAKRAQRFENLVNEK